jgi:hypothetical protein
MKKEVLLFFKAHPTPGLSALQSLGSLIALLNWEAIGLLKVI